MFVKPTHTKHHHQPAQQSSAQPHQNSKKTARVVNENKVFKKNDFNYSQHSKTDTRKFSARELSDLEFAGNCCAFPKLAVYISRTTRFKDLHQIVTHINQCDSKEIRTMTPKPVLESLEKP